MSEVAGRHYGRVATASVAAGIALVGLAFEGGASAQVAPNPNEADLRVSSACDPNGQGFLLIATTSNGPLEVNDKDGLVVPTISFQGAGEQAYKVPDSVYAVSFFDLNKKILIDRDDGIVVACQTGTSSTTSSTSISTSTSTTRPPSTTSTTRATTTTSPSTTSPTTTPSTIVQPTTPNAKTGDGYHVFGSDANIITFGADSIPRGVSRYPVVAGDPTPNGESAHVLTSNGTVINTQGIREIANSQSGDTIPAVGIVAGANDTGHFVKANGEIVSYGLNTEKLDDLKGIPLNQPIVGLEENPAGEGHWQVAKDGGVFAQGGARFFGSMGGTRLNAPVVGMKPTPTGEGYWLVAKDGGIFAFGDARFHGSTGGVQLEAPVRGMATTATGDGYYTVAEDGGVFAFNAPFEGSAANTGTYGKAPAYGKQIVAIASASKNS